MRIRCIFFALYRDLAGASELDLELPAEGTAADLVAQVRARGVQAARIPAEPVVAINETYASLSTRLKDGDEVAFLPPVAGG
jgi:molybdopterin converting factor subunit 1